MGAVRLILVVLIGGSLGLLYLQNRTPELSLTFLGMQSRPLPLALWLVAAVGLGLMTSLILTSLVRLSNFLTSRDLLDEIRELETELDRRRGYPGSAGDRPPTPTPASSQAASSRTIDSNWDEDEEPVKEPLKAPPPPFDQRFASTNPRRRNATEVVDADYRVIVPPPPESSPSVRKDDPDEDDWGFSDEDLDRPSSNR
jgi:hypothetical protein